MKQKNPESSNAGYFFISSNKILRVVKEDEILYLKSEDCYTWIYLVDQSSYFMCGTLKKHEKKLTKKHFFRCHKSFLVNRSFIRESHSGNIHKLILTNGDEIPMARRRFRFYRKELKPFK